MRKTEILTVYPWNLGLDTTSIPGTQNPASLVRAENIVLNNNGSRSKKPGIVPYEFIGSGNPVTFLRGATDLHGTNGSGQFQEILRVVDGRLEVIRGSDIIDLQVTGFTEYDSVSFVRFVNTIIVFFENRAPVYYTVGSSAAYDVPIPLSHQLSPPRVGTVHNSRFCYAGRGNNPHVLTMSAINSIADYTLLSGGLSLKIRDGDGDPLGITALSPTFRGDLFVFKSQSLYRLYNASYTYGVDTVTDQVGCVAPNTVVATQNDLFWVSDRGIHSLTMTSNYGAAEEATITYPIYEKFIESVNWAAAKYMWATYDIYSNSYILAYPSAGSPVPNKILGFNITNRQFFEWVDQDYGCVFQYIDDSKRRRTMVGLNNGKLGYLNEKITTAFDEGISVDIETPLIFPKRNPARVCNFTRGKLMCRPTSKDVYIRFSYRIDSNDVATVELNTYGSGFGSVIDGDQNSDLIGTGVIGENKSNIVAITLPIQGTGSSIQLRFEQVPPDEDPDQYVEMFGYEIEFDYNEDTDKTIQI